MRALWRNVLDLHLRVANHHMPWTKDRSIYYARRWVKFRDYPSHVPVVTLGGNTLKLTRTRTGESVKDYKTLIRQQRNATSNMSGTFDDAFVSPAPLNWQLRHLNFADTTPDPNDVYEYRCTGVFHPNFVVQDPSIGLATATNRALIAFLKKARKIQREFSSPTFLGELAETYKMMRNPGEGLRHILDGFLRQVTKDKVKKPREWKKNLSAAWLEHSFGWMPLANDLKDGYNAYSNLVKGKDGEQRVISAIGIEAKKVPNKTGVQALTSPFGDGIYAAQYVQTAIERCVVKYRGAIVRRVDATLRDKLSRVGFEPIEFVPTAWELLPWSFLIDYFSNIGDVLEAGCFNLADLAWVDNVSVQFYIHQSLTWPDHAYMKSSMPNHYVSSSGEPATMFLRRRLVQRTKNITVGFPSLALELPGRPAQWTNMLALWAQANSIHPQRFKYGR